MRVLRKSAANWISCIRTAAQSGADPVHSKRQPNIVSQLGTLFQQMVARRKFGLGRDKAHCMCLLTGLRVSVLSSASREACCWDGAASRINYLIVANPQFRRAARSLLSCLRNPRVTVHQGRWRALPSRHGQVLPSFVLLERRTHRHSTKHRRLCGFRSSCNQPRLVRKLPIIFRPRGK